MQVNNLFAFYQVIVSRGTKYDQVHYLLYITKLWIKLAFEGKASKEEILDTLDISVKIP